MKRLLLCFCLGTLALWTSNGSAGDNTQPGLWAEFFAFDSALEDFPAIPADKKPAVQRLDKTIDVDAGDDAWPGTQLSTHFYIRWTGKLHIPQDGKYTFFLNSDDGSRLFIEGKQVVDNGGLHAAQEKSGEVDLKAGDHDLKLEFFQNEGEAVCKFSWQPPGKDKEIVPAAALLCPAPEAGPAKSGLQAEFFALDGELEDFPSIPADKKPTLQRVDKTIDVDAGDNAWPGTQLSEHFYIRWTGKLRIPQDGKYTFFLNSDDGSRLFVGGKQVVDNGGLHSAEEKSGDVDLKAGDHDLKLEFFQNEGEAVCKFSWQPPGKDKEIVPAAALLCPAPEAGPAKSGLQAEFFALDGELEDFPSIPAVKKPTLQRVDKTIDVDAGDGAWPGTQLSEHFYIRWTGKLRIPQDGKYTFFLNSDDGSRLFIAGKQVVDNGGLHSAEEKSGEVDLKAGGHDLKLEFFQNEGEAVCKFSWQPPGKDKEIVPATALSH